MTIVPPSDPPPAVPPTDPPYKPGRWFQLGCLLFAGWSLWEGITTSSLDTTVWGINFILFAVLEEVPHHRKRLRLAIIVPLMLANAGLILWNALT